MIDIIKKTKITGKTRLVSEVTQSFKVAIDIHEDCYQRGWRENNIEVEVVFSCVGTWCSILRCVGDTSSTGSSIPLREHKHAYWSIAWIARLVIRNSSQFQFAKLKQGVERVVPENIQTALFSNAATCFYVRWAVSGNDCLNGAWFVARQCKGNFRWKVLSSCAWKSDI